MKHAAQNGNERKERKNLRLPIFISRAFLLISISFRD